MKTRLKLIDNNKDRKRTSSPRTRRRTTDPEGGTGPIWSHFYRPWSGQNRFRNPRISLDQWSLEPLGTRVRQIRGGPQSALKISDLRINAALISYRSAPPPKPRMPIPDDILDQRPPVLHLSKPIDVHGPGVRTRDLPVMDHHPETILRQERVVVAAKGLKVPPARLGGEFVGQEDAEFSAANW